MFQNLNNSEAICGREQVVCNPHKNQEKKQNKVLSCFVQITLSQRRYSTTVSPNLKGYVSDFCDLINTNNLQKSDTILYKNLAYIIKNLEHRCMNGTHASNALMSISMEILQTCMWTKIKRAKKLHPIAPKPIFITLNQK